jgi:hypothetical protein
MEHDAMNNPATEAPSSPAEWHCRYGPRQERAQAAAFCEGAQSAYSSDQNSAVLVVIAGLDQVKPDNPCPWEYDSS